MSAKKKKNPLKLYTFSYRPLYYLIHPWKWFHELYMNTRNFIHRGRYGYAYMDVWNFCHWWPIVGAEALRYMAEHGSGYPGIDPWGTYQKWKDYLLTLAEKLEWCAESGDFINPIHSTRNEYYDQWVKIKVTPIGKMTDEERKIIDAYWIREHDLELEDETKRSEIFSEIGKHLPRFWD